MTISKSIALGFFAFQLMAQIPASITTHTDTIPVYGSTPTIVAQQDGEWTDPATWDLARVPNASDAVHIPSGRNVHGTGAMQALDVVVEGNLTLDGGFDLPVRTITVLPSGDLKLLQAGNIAIRDIAIDTNFDPDQFGNGILVIDGAITIASTNPRQTWATLAEEIEAGNTSITFVTAPENWQAGDTLILPDTRQPSAPEDLAAVNSQVERVTVQSVSGSTVTLTAPVAFDHLGWHNQQGEAEILPDVGNLTQSIAIGSENPLGTPGHVLFARHADVEVDGLSLVQMGRTTVAPLDPVANHIARYPLHFHHTLGRPNNGKPHQFRAHRVAVDGSPKVGIVVHGSHYGDVTGNFVYDAAGAGIFTEDPLEYGNDISDNLIVFYRDGSGQRITSRAGRNEFGGDHWHNKVGLGLQSAMNRIVDNHIYGAFDGIGMAGFRTTALHWPEERGVHVMSQPPYGTPGIIFWSDFYQPEDWRYPFVFDTSGNQIWGSWRGIETWTADSYPNKPEQMFPGLTIVNTRQGTNFQDHEETTTYNWRFRGDFSQVSSPSGFVRGDASGNPDTVTHSVAVMFKGGYEFGATFNSLDVRGYSVGYLSQLPSFYTLFPETHWEVATVVYQPDGRRFFWDAVDELGWTGTWENNTFVPVAGVPLKFIQGHRSDDADIQLWLFYKNNPNRRFLPPVKYEVKPWIDGRELNIYHTYQRADWEHPTPITAPDFYGDFPPGIYKNQDLINMGTPIFGAVIPEWAEQDPAFPGFYIATPGGPSIGDLLQQIEQLEQQLEQCQQSCP